MNPACPHLPEVERIHDFRITRRHGAAKGPEFYLDALRFAQSQWLAGKPAQAILQLNKAWMADLHDASGFLEQHPPPYRALVWILRTAASGECGFLGDPVRHFQHLATRMSGPQAEIRSWRAWCCLNLAENVLSPSSFRRDGPQMAREGFWIPGFGASLAALTRLGWPGESRVAESAIDR